MTLAVTAMVRDEADVIRQWVEYHLAQGVDVLIVTDNASTDGTAEILQEFSSRGLLHLRHDGEHRKQQGKVVTAMAREAATVHGADWVVNADADEFLVPMDRSRRLADVFAELDPTIGAFTVPVVNLVGPLAHDGAGFDRLVWRDERSNDQLQAVGVLAQPTPNAVHVADPDVTVAQGNHIVSIANAGEVPEALALEVLHLPWRSWQQLEHKTELAGKGYEANPDLTPSPNHHGMLDYRRWQEGTLLAYVAARFVDEDDAAHGPFTYEPFLPTFLDSEGISRPTPDERADRAEIARLRRLGRALVDRDARIRALEVALAEQHDRTRRELDDVRRMALGAERESERLRVALTALQRRKVVRYVDAVAGRLRRH